MGKPNETEIDRLPIAHSQASISIKDVILDEFRVTLNAPNMSWSLFYQRWMYQSIDHRPAKAGEG